MTILKQIKENVFADSFGRNKAGNIVLRREFFYTHGKTSEDFASKVQAQLDSAGIAANVIDSGEQWAAFRGGASVAKSSHWWVEVAV